MKQNDRGNLLSKDMLMSDKTILLNRNRFDGKWGYRKYSTNDPIGHNKGG